MESEEESSSEAVDSAQLAQAEAALRRWLDGPCTFRCALCQDVVQGSFAFGEHLMQVRKKAPLCPVEFINLRKNLMTFPTYLWWFFYAEVEKRWRHHF